MPAALFSHCNNLIDSSKASSPSHYLTQGSVENSTYQDRPFFRNPAVMQSLDTDRKDLVNCLLGEMSQADQ